MNKLLENTKFSLFITLLIAGVLFTAGCERKVQQTPNASVIDVFSSSQWGQIEELNKILQSNPAAAKQTEDYGQTPLHFACNAAIAHLLVQSGADINAKDHNGATPIHTASRDGIAEVITLLIENKADINTKDKNGDTPLHLASNAQSADILIKNGADINAKNNHGESPLCLAVLLGDIEIVKLLINSKCDMNITNNEGISPLQQAKSNGENAIADLLLQSGAKQ